MARRVRSSLFAILALDALLIGAWLLSAAFVPPAAPRGADLRMGGAAAVAAAAMTQLPSGAEAVAKWEYKEPAGDLSPEQILILISFFLIHAAGVADFYAKKTGAGPAVPFNPFRQQQFWSDEKKEKLFGYGINKF